MNKFSREEVIENSVKYFNGDTLAATVWLDKYALKDKEGNIYELTPDDMHKRMAKEFARIENKYSNPISEATIYELFKDFRYIVPGGSPSAGVGNSHVTTSLSNCFVIPPAIDSYGGIMKTDQEQVQLMKRRGGVGHDMSLLRPTGTPANGSLLNGQAGCTLYMDRFSYSTREVAQDGRRGALMLSIRISHPDAELFIDKKLDTTKVTGANISVKIDDEFMYAVANDGEYAVHFENDAVVYPTTKINARKLWDKITHNAWKSAEPGILFWDTILRESPTRGYNEKWRESSTNPCGEIPLCPYDSCRLMAMNLFSYVVNPFTEDAYFDMVLFKSHTVIAQRLMDDLVDLEIEKVDAIIAKILSDPEPESTKSVELGLWRNIREMAVNGRRTGLGITGEGDMLAGLGWRYGSEDATTISEAVHKQMAISAYSSSIILAEQRGSFPEWGYNEDMESDFIKRIIKVLPADIFQKYLKSGRRNIALMTIAPTGTTSLMTQTTSGIEPVFMPVYKRKRKVGKPTKGSILDAVGDSWEEYTVYHHNFLKWMNINGYDTEKEYSSVELDLIVKDSPYYKATSNDVDYKQKVELQGRIQKWVDHSISVTVNMHKDVAISDVDAVYQKAWESGCKGITIYRDGSRSGVMEAIDSSNELFHEHTAPKRPKELVCIVNNIKVGSDKYSVLIGLFDDKPYEVFSTPEHIKDVGAKIIKEKRGKYSYNGIVIAEDMNELQKSTTRLISTALRHGANVKYVVEQLNKTEGGMSTFSKAIARTLKKFIKNGEKSTEKCPTCDTQLVFKDGCKSCNNCGWEACS